MNKSDTQEYFNISHIFTGYSIVRISASEDDTCIVVQMHKESRQCPDAYVKFRDCANLNIHVKRVKKAYAPISLGETQITKISKRKKHVKVTLQDFEGEISFDCEQICKIYTSRKSNHP